MAIFISLFQAVDADQLPTAAADDSVATSAPVTPADGDVALSGYGDSSGYHLQVAQSGAAFREVAVLRPAAMDPSSWVGYQCLSGDGQFAAVTVLPDSSVNLQEARDRGAFAFSVDLTSGQVHPIASGVGLKYFSPGCGAGEDAVFTSYLGTDDSSTVLTTANLATGDVSASVTVAGQVTSAVPTDSGVVGVAGSALVDVAADGTVAVRAQLAGDVYELHPDADGNINFLTTTQDAPTADAHHETDGAVTDLASGPRTTMHLFGGRDGNAILTGADTTTADSLAPANVTSVSDDGLVAGASSASLDGSLLVGTGNQDSLQQEHQNRPD